MKRLNHPHQAITEIEGILADIELGKQSTPELEQALKLALKELYQIRDDIKKRTTIASQNLAAE